MLSLTRRLHRPYGVLVAEVFGTTDAAQVEAALLGLPLEIRRCFHFEISVGALFGVELGDGRRVALKVHQARVGAPELEAQQVVQAHLADRGFPCPRPVLGPTPFLVGLCSAEEWRTDGRRYGVVTGARRRAMAEAVLRITELGAELPRLPPLEAYQARQELWPEPHNALFDFDATRAGAEEIDAIAGRAARLMHAGPVVLGHQDFSLKHFRFGAGGQITIVYDWDSLSVDHESVALGGAAATHTAALHVRIFELSVETTLAFVDAYEDGRGGLPAEVRRAALAYAVYIVAYTARCEHALSVARGSRRLTAARAALPSFASELLP
ncbi:MAG: phosphotransferase [Gaiellaceae bacterium]